MAIDTTVGGASANSYASVAEYRTYAGFRLPAVAAAVSAVDANVEVALVIGARIIDQDFTWTGVATDPATDDPTQHQRLCWPRRGMATRNGFNIPSNTLPRELKDAQCEVAYELLAGLNLIADNDALNAGLSSIKAGSVALSFQSVSIDSTESMDTFMRRMNSEFNYLGPQIKGEVRRILVPSWFEQPSIIRPVIFGAFGPTRRT